jgi:oligopeptide transport system ATP-binding protein
MGFVRTENLTKHFPLSTSLFSREKRIVQAVERVTLHIDEGDTVGLVGESGCGKTTLGKLLIRLLEPTCGTVEFMEHDIFKLSENELRRLRSQFSMIFQDPSASLNPRKTVRRILMQPYLFSGKSEGLDLDREVSELLKMVGIAPPELYIDRYPHEFSGGQRQRIVIARAIALRPKFIIADEPVSALDVSIRATVLNLMRDLQLRLKLTYLFITHDLSVVRSVCNKVAVMYLGRIVELADVEELYKNPLHPYTKALFSAVPLPDPEVNRTRTRIILHGDVPSPINVPSGCRFHPRCSFAQQRCKRDEPELIDVGGNHFLSCPIVGNSAG